MPVAVITAHGNVEAAVRALKLGAFDFISKPLDLNALRKLITATLKLGGSSSRRPGRHAGLRMLGDSKPMQQLRQMIGKVARSQAPVHIAGDSGTGKELVARLIHESGPRREGPFVPVNCGAIPSELMESELFGHKKGSFTGAVADKEGLIRSAEGGTLFLDEVADLPLHMQVKLLRVIQEKSVRAGGRDAGAAGRRAHPVRDASQARRAGQGGQVPRGPVLPHQRHRAARARVARAAGRRAGAGGHAAGCASRSRWACRGLTDRPTRRMDKLLSYAYPGNVRELENILERAVTLCTR